MLALAQFSAIIGCTFMTAEKWHGPFETAMAERQINTPRRIACFLAQVGHESGSLSRIDENLNYSAQRLMAVWPRRFPTIERARFFEHAPERLANEVYGGRMGNGSYDSGDGFRFRGRGCMQLTGATNYRRCGIALNLPLIEQPDLLLEPLHSARAAAWFWEERGLNPLADAMDIDRISDLINIGKPTPAVGDAAGYADRAERTGRALRILGAS